MKATKQTIMSRRQRVFIHMPEIPNIELLLEDKFSDFIVVTSQFVNEYFFK